MARRLARELELNKPYITKSGKIVYLVRQKFHKWQYNVHLGRHGTRTYFRECMCYFDKDGNRYNDFAYHKKKWGNTEKLYELVDKDFPKLFSMAR